MLNKVENKYFFWSLNIKIKQFIKKFLNFKFYIKIFLYKNLKFFFYKNLNRFYIQEHYLIFRLYGTKLYFFKNNLKFLFLNFKSYFSFFINFFNIYHNFHSLYFFRLRLKGLGFALKRYSKNLFSFLLTINHYFYFFIPSFILIKKKKRSIMCVSLDKVRLNILFWHLLFLKKYNVYARTKKLNGFVKANFIRFVRKKYKL